MCVPVGSEAFCTMRNIYPHQLLSTWESVNTVARPRYVFAAWATIKFYYHIYFYIYVLVPALVVVVLAIVVVVVVAKIVVLLLLLLLSPHVPDHSDLSPVPSPPC